MRDPLQAAEANKYDRPVEHAIQAVMRRARELAEERRQAARVFSDLLAGRRRADLSAAEAGLLRGVPFIELLLEQSHALRFRDPEEMLALAGLAVHAVERLDPEQHGGAVLADLRARAWGELGNAHRVAGDFAAAGEALGNAAAWARQGTGDLLLTARISDIRASLCIDQGLFAEAAALLRLVHAACLSLGDEHLAGRALIKEGIACGHAGHPEQAVATIRQGLALVDAGREPALQLLGLHNLIFNLVESGEPRRARSVLKTVRALSAKSGDFLNLLRLRWLEGKIDAGLGDFQAAESHFKAVRRSFRRLGQTYDAALAGLDLAMLWARQGRRQEVRKLAAGLAGTFRALRIARETIASLLVLGERCADPAIPDGILQDQIRMVTALLAAARHRRAPSRRQR